MIRSRAPKGRLFVVTSFRFSVPAVVLGAPAVAGHAGAERLPKPAEAAGLVPNKDLPYLSGAFASLLQNCEMCVLQDFLLGTTEVMFRDMDA